MKLQHDIGDILIGGEFLSKIIIRELINKTYVYRINIGEVNMSQFEYLCPFIEGNRYYWFYPSLRFTDIPNKENVFPLDKPRKIQNIEDWQECSDVNAFSDNSFMMGHGYTSGTLPCDGHGSKYPACLYEENGDILVGFTWIWFNK